MAAVPGLKARIKLTSQTATTDASEATSLVGGTTSQYQIDDATKRHIDKSVAPAIYDGVTLVGSSAYEIDYVTGTVTMSTSATGAVTFQNFSYLTASYLSGGRSWTVNGSVTPLDVTTFSTTATDPRWKKYQAGIAEATVNISRITPAPTTADPTFFDLINTESQFVLELYPDDSAGDRYECYALVSSLSREASVTDIQTEGIDFTVIDKLHYTTST